MNSTIKHLINKSDHYVGPNEPKKEFEEKGTRLAKMILEECISLCHKNYVGQIGSHTSAHNGGITKCITSIKEHFGLE